jgi:hypothetical protein
VRFWKKSADKKYLYLRKWDVHGWRKLMKRIFVILHINWFSTDTIKEYVMGWNRRMREENEKFKGFGLKIVRGPLGRLRHEWEKILKISSMKRMGECGGS